MNIIESDQERFWKRVNKKGPTVRPELGPCWIYRHKSKAAYNRFTINGEEFYTHRVSWIIASGPIPDGLSVCHKCDNPPCVRPSHLFLGTQSDNMRDCSDKGRLSNPPIHEGETHHNATLTDEQAAKLRAEFKAGANQRALAKKYRCSNSTAWRIGKGVTR